MNWFSSVQIITLYKWFSMIHDWSSQLSRSLSSSAGCAARCSRCYWNWTVSRYRESSKDEIKAEQKKKKMRKIKNS